MCERYYGVPYRHPWDVNVIRVNYSCLEAPKVFTDFDGFWCMPPVIRRIVPGLIETPKSSVVPVQPRQLHAMILPIMQRLTVIDFNLDDLPPYIFKFGVDKPYILSKIAKDMQCSI